jgi:2,4-dienoyl-CoA reductase-like NADH-dependent reductase (Old Yellow Enzyme family)
LSIAKSPYAHSSQPIRIGNVEIKNRILMTAMPQITPKITSSVIGISRSIASARIDDHWAIAIMTHSCFCATTEKDQV